MKIFLDIVAFVLRAIVYLTWLALALVCLYFLVMTDPGRVTLLIVFVLLSSSVFIRLLFWAFDRKDYNKFTRRLKSIDNQISLLDEEK